jgi:hypothetical protein
MAARGGSASAADPRASPGGRRRGTAEPRASPSGRGTRHSRPPSESQRARGAGLLPRLQVPLFPIIRASHSRCSVHGYRVYAGETNGRTRVQSRSSQDAAQFELRHPRIGLTLVSPVAETIYLNGPFLAPVAQLASGHGDSGARSPGVVIQPATSCGPRARQARRPAAICRVAVAWHEKALASRRSKSSGLLSRRCGFEPRRAY